MNLNDKKIVVAIENAVCEQLEASGINTDPFRLDGEKIVDVILEQLEGFVLVPKEFNEKLAEKMAAEMVNKLIPENDPVWIEIANKAYKDNLLMKKWEIIRNYKAMIEAAQGEGHE